MPSKYIVRKFSENSYYNIYNRGADKKIIFVDDKDFSFFITYLFIYTRPPEEVKAKFPDLPKRLHAKNLAHEIELIGYCLMPNHFHLLLKQNSKDGISKLMKQMINAYTLYFNQKHQKSGPLMAGRYKAINVPFNMLIPLLRLLQTEPTNYTSYNFYLSNSFALACSQEFKKHILSLYPNLTKFVEYHKNQMNIAKIMEKVAPYIIEL